MKIYNVGDIITAKLNHISIIDIIIYVRILNERVFKYGGYVYEVEELTPTKFPKNAKFYIYEYQIVE